MIENKKNSETQTRAGRYVVGIIGKHKSAQRWLYSTIEWGAPLREKDGKLQYQQNNIWINLSSNPIISKVASMYADFKNQISNVLSREEKMQKLPAVWLFNDFGHVTIKYFKDLNNNYRQDKNEQLLTDFVHTIPYDEYYSKYNYQVAMPDSHGCIHMHPKDIDIVLYFIKIGSVIEVHHYNELNIPFMIERPFGRPLYEAHFFPLCEVRSHLRQDEWLSMS